METSKSIRIETERLLIRRMEECDLQDFMEYDSHPDFQFCFRDPYTEDQVRELIDYQHNLALGAEQWFKLSVELKLNSKMIGDVCIKVLNKTHRQGEIGWDLNPNYQRQGFAAEASKALLELGFTTLDLHRITARCDVMNERSYRLMERLGMRREATFKEVVYFEGTWHDQYTYAILKDEWKANHSWQSTHNAPSQ